MIEDLRRFRATPEVNQRKPAARVHAFFRLEVHVGCSLAENRKVSPKNYETSTLVTSVTELLIIASIRDLGARVAA